MDKSKFLTLVSQEGIKTNVDIELFNDYTGERLAINEFNLNNADIKISSPYHFLAQSKEAWHHQIWIIHFFKHLKYNLFISQDNPKLPI